MPALSLLQGRGESCAPVKLDMPQNRAAPTRTGSRVRELASIVELVCDTCRLTGAECETTCWEESQCSECASEVDGSRAWCDRLLPWTPSSPAATLLLLGAAGSL